MRPELASGLDSNLIGGQCVEVGKCKAMAGAPAQKKQKSNARA